MEHVPFPHEQSQAADSRRWAFLRRRRNKETPPAPEQAPSAPVSNVRKFAHNIMGLLGAERPAEAPAPENLPPTEIPVSRARKWGRRVLDFVGRTEQKIEVSPPSPTRTENRRVMREAKADMQDAQQDLEAAAHIPSAAESHFASGPDFIKDVKQEMRRTVRSLRKEREMLKNAQPPSETANAVTLGILAMIGGGLFMSVIDNRHTRKKIEKQEKVIQKQEARIETLEQQLEVVKTPERELVRRIGEFTHKQAALTREVAEEIRAERVQVPEVPVFFAEPRQPERAATFTIPEISKPEVAQEQARPGQNGGALAAGGVGLQNSQQLSATQSRKDQSKIAAKPKKKKTPPKDPVAGYVAAAVATAAALALWFALSH